MRSQAEVTNLVNQLENQQNLSAVDLPKVRDLFRAIAVTVRAQDEQLRYFENLVAILKDGNAATLAAGTAALNALKSIAPPTATVDQQAATQAIAKLRTDLQNATDISQTVAGVASFALSLVGKFV
jgi:hypothetical protein